MVQSAAETELGALSERLAQQYRSVRTFTERLCQPLSAEDCAIQSMPDASPTRWHVAHTTWFFETFVLSSQPGYCVYHPQYCYLFNSYYNAVGNQYPRPKRGLLSRPSLAEVMDYRESVDDSMLRLLEEELLDGAQLSVVELGLQHEQQHQELILTDIKHVFSCNPLLPIYRLGEFDAAAGRADRDWIDIEEGLHRIGHEGHGFAYDNESPHHPVFLQQARVADRLVTCGEYLEFIEDDGYRRPELWLSQGWSTVNEMGWQAPSYWMRHDGSWHVFTLAGPVPLDPGQPVCHVSYFEADAYASWAGARLPTEHEWEVAAQTTSEDGVFVERLVEQDQPVHPQVEPADRSSLLGNVWQWTSSPYVAYPGYRPSAGALGEYNGKFMCNQFVLRGGSCATSQSHIRRTYRNFFPPNARWQFSGIRLAQ